MGRQQRFTLGEDGLLRSREGVVLGRLTSVTLDLYLEEPRGVRGGEEVSPQQTTLAVGSSDVDENRKAVGGVGGSPTSATQRIWDHYQQVVPGASRRILDPTTVRIIQNGLRVRPEERCMEAIDGLAASRFHNGENEGRKKYLGIRYALKGNSKTGETNDERIDKMAELAPSTSAGILATVPSELRAMVKHRQRQVEEMLLNPGDENRRGRALGSVAYLRDHWGLAATLKDGQVTWEKVEP